MPNMSKGGREGGEGITAGPFSIRVLSPVPSLSSCLSTSACARWQKEREGKKVTALSSLLCNSCWHEEGRLCSLSKASLKAWDCPRPMPSSTASVCEGECWHLLPDFIVDTSCSRGSHVCVHSSKSERGPWFSFDGWHCEDCKWTAPAKLPLPLLCSPSLSSAPPASPLFLLPLLCSPAPPLLPLPLLCSLRPQSPSTEGSGEVPRCVLCSQYSSAQL